MYCKNSKKDVVELESNRSCWSKGVVDGIPIFLGYIAVSFTFGIMAKSYNLSIWQATLMSATNVTSAGQFASLDLIQTAAPYLELALTQFIINLRYSLMSCSLSQKLDANTPLYHRFLMSFGITDEVFCVSSAVKGSLNPFYTYGLMTIAIPGWILGTLLGVLLGNIMPARLLRACSVALYGMFIAVVVPPTKYLRVLLGVVAFSMLASAAFSLLPLLRDISSGTRIIVLTVVIAGLAATFFPVKEQREQEDMP